LEQADASDSVELAQADRRGSRDGATWFQRRYEERPRSGRLPPERALPACGIGARRECPARNRASTPRPATMAIRAARRSLSRPFTSDSRRVVSP